MMNRTISCTTILAMLFVCLCAGRVLGDDQEAPKPKPEKPAEKKAEEPKKDGTKWELKVKAKPAKKIQLEANAIAQNEAMVQQWIQQFRPILTAELNFIRQVCDLSKEQRPKIKAAGEASLKEAATKFAQSQQGGRNGVIVNGRGVANSQPNIRTIIREGLGAALKEVLTAEQMSRYSEEAAARSAQHKRATILSVVSRLDGALSLDAAQREEITSALTSNWQDNWEQWLVLNQYHDMYFQQVPDQFLLAHLNDEQKSVWRGLQKLAPNNLVGNQGVQQPDDAEWWGDEPAKQDVPAVLKKLGDWLIGNH